MKDNTYTLGWNLEHLAHSSAFYATMAETKTDNGYHVFQIASLGLWNFNFILAFLVFSTTSNGKTGKSKKTNSLYKR